MAESSRVQSLPEEYTYGYFKVKASENLSAENAEKLAVLFELKPTVLDTITRASNPGLKLLQTLNDMSIISEESIENLLDAMNKIDLQARASKLRKEFSKIKKVGENEEQDPGAVASNLPSPTAEKYLYLTKEEVENNLKEGAATLKVINSFKKKEYEKRIMNYSLKRHHKLQMSSHDGESMHIAMLGKTGDGKSSTANTILGRETFKTASSSKSLTKFSSNETSTFKNRKVTVVDTPGVHDTEQDPSIIKREILRWAFLLRGGFNCFIICMNASDPRFKKETQEMLKHIKPDGGFDNYCMLVYIRAESELSQCSLDDFIERKKDDESYKRFIDAIDARVVAVNNTTQIPAEQQRNREAILAMAEKIVKENKAQGLKERYTNKLIEQAERLHSKITTVVEENNMHPILVNAAVESFIDFSGKIKSVQTFQEKILHVLLKRQDSKLDDVTKTLSFNYNDTEIELSRDVYEKHIKLIFDNITTELKLLNKIIERITTKTVIATGSTLGILIAVMKFVK